MKHNVYYGTKPRITNDNRHDFDRGNYECALVLKDHKGNPVVISQSKNSASPVWKVESGFSCFFFTSREDALAFCKTRYKKAEGGTA